MNALHFRLAAEADFAVLRPLIIDSFEPITWFKKLDTQFGPLNGMDWRARWEARLDRVFASQMILVGEVEGQIVAVATGTVDHGAKLGFVDLLGVHPRHQNKGYGKAMLRGMLDYFRSLGMEQAHLECLTDNDRGNALYGSEGWQIVSTSHHWFTKL
ncbi:MAG: GNAT family N-acetyltransferase [Bryobacterales bacterium]|nr:GNAT family N-acetyltransferase [Bryobacterales bacterium]